MSTDRELLELAAKAAGYSPAVVTDDGVVLLRGVRVRWSPLTDDGDRYRLIAALKMGIDFDECTVWKRLPNSVFIQEFWGGDCGDEAHAVLRAAAEIGRALP